MLIATGSHENLKPENVLGLICEKAGLTYDRFHYRVLRLETYYGDSETGFKSLDEAGRRV